MNILLFGGAFNPPHLGHQLVISQAYELIPNIDELWLMPCYGHTFGKSMAPAPHRLRMCELLVNGVRESQNSARSRTPLAGVEDGNFETKHDTVKICSIEIDRQTSGSTYETLQLLKKENEPPNNRTASHTFSFLMGSDQLPTFHKWESYQQLLQQMHFYIYPRGGLYPPLAEPPPYDNMTLLESPTQVITNISSTLIRNRISQNLPISSIIPPPIEEYIKSHHLYSL